MHLLPVTSVTVSLPYMDWRWSAVVSAYVRFFLLRGRAVRATPFTERERESRSGRAGVRRVFHSYGQTERQT